MRLDGGKIYTLAYADDVVLLAEEEGGMKCMVEIGEELNRKGLNVGKSKMIRLERKGKGEEM